MAKVHPIVLDGIVFDPGSAEPLAARLAYPFYGNLVDAEMLDRATRNDLQLEPAFQFRNGVNDPDSYEFSFVLAEEGVHFTRGPASSPSWSWALPEAATPAVTSVYFPPGDDSFRTCIVRVIPALWTEEHPSVVCLRIFCTTGRKQGNGCEGVSLSLIRRDDTSVPLEPAPPGPPVGSFEIPVDTAGREAPHFKIFRDLELPPNLVLGPAFRISAAKPQLSLSLALLDPGLKYQQAPPGSEDGVKLCASTASRPVELSRIQANHDRNNARFTWKLSPEYPYRVFSFTLNTCMETDNAATPTRHLDVDPVLFNDPPPSG